MEYRILSWEDMREIDTGPWKTPHGQMWADVEVKGEPSKWITLFALIVLDHFEA